MRQGPFPPEDLLARLSAIYPSERLLADPAELSAFESDALTAYAVRPRVVVIAETEEEVIETVRLCAELEVPFVPRGSGTSLSGGSLPVENGVVIALNRMNRILELDADGRVAVVEPGAINTQVSEASAAHGLRYAPDPSSQQVCTIGGNVAFNSGGAHCLKYGMTANHVLGIRAVLATGEVVELGSDSLEQIGPDWTGLFVGSEGLFGIALRITLRLLPPPECYHTVLAGYPSLEAAGDVVSEIVSSGLLPGAIELMDRLALEAATAAVAAEFPPGAEAVLIVELEGPRDLIQAERRRLDALIASSSTTGIRIASTPAERAAIWKGRKSAFSAVGRLSPDFIVQDGVVPRGKLGYALRRIDELAAARDLRVANVFHAGDGNLHPLILYNGRAEGEFERAEELAGEILDMCIELGGSITGEHGVGMEKRAFLARMFGEDDLDALERIHRAIDPAGIANRGKMFPDGPRLRIARSEPNHAPKLADAERADALKSLRPTTPGEVRAAVAGSTTVLPHGRLTKAPLVAALEDATLLDMRGLTGIVEYLPDEFTFTAYAGTPLREIEAMLAEHGQYMPFDPPFVDQGATLGGTVAAGLSGSGRWRFGGVRDFILGVRFVDGSAQLIRGGGKVVKNAAGFDLPKLMVGSRGRLGVIVELTFKVFPSPAAWRTIRVSGHEFADALALMADLGRQPFDLAALDIEPPATLVLRVAGDETSLAAHAERIAVHTGRTCEQLSGQADAAYWSHQRAFAWSPSDHRLIKVALSPRQIPALEAALAATNPLRRYAVGGHLAWIAWPAGTPLAQLELGGLPGIVVRGDARDGAPAELGHVPATTGPFARAVKRALDPRQRLPALA